MRTSLYIASLAVLCAVVTVPNLTAQTPRQTYQERMAQKLQTGLSEWAKIYEVFSHPRCVNCHVGQDNRPRWSGAHYGLAPGEWEYHGMYLNAGDSRDGAQVLPCTTCHVEQNSDVLNGPPGAHVWALAPVEMEWFGKSSSYICEQIKDPARNGGRSLRDVADHIANDELVHWGWAPGPGREAAPYNAQLTAQAVNAWRVSGAPCPPEDVPVQPISEPEQ